MDRLGAFYLWHSLATSTRRTYSAGQNSFIRFCQANGKYNSSGDILPPSEHQIVAWVSSLGGHVKVATIKQYLTHLRSLLIENGWGPEPTQTYTLQKVVQGIARYHGLGDRRERLAITLPILRDICAWLDSRNTFEDQLFGAAARLAWAGFLRCGEFTVKNGAAWNSCIGLSHDSVRFIPDFATAERISLLIPASKTDPFRTGVTIHIAAAPRAITCPVAALKHMFTAYPAPLDSPLLQLRDGLKWSGRGESNDWRIQSAPNIHFLNLLNHHLRAFVMDSARFMLCATTRALAIPEVVTYIIDNNCLSRADLASISLVCCYMSKVAAPFLWKNSTAEGLLRLIKSTKISRRPDGRVRTICHDAHTGDYEPFKDFHNYAQYVKTLEIYDRNSRPCYTVDSWPVLLAEMKAQGRSLLPNLRALRFLNTSQSHGMDEFKWLQTFATPGLKEVSLMPNALSPAGRIPFPIASAILGVLVKLCSGIQILELAPSDDHLCPETLDSSQPWYQAIQAIPHLRHLTVSEGWFYPAGLRALGRLTELESLTVVPEPLDGFGYEFDIDPTVFAGMLRQITTMKLEFHFDVDDDRYMEFEKIFHGLRSAPCLRELCVDFAFHPGRGERPANVYWAMGEMGLHPSLEHIHLDGIRIDKTWRRKSNLRYIRRVPGSIWPNVRTLSMPSQSASIRELEDFATLPSLTHLTVNLDLKYPYFPAKPGFTCAPFKILTSSGPVRLSTDFEDISLSAA
ncbi:hypothetical protein RSAG8_07171, partial [Rhizoctonia solani AG-8 WAC10335]